MVSCNIAAKWQTKHRDKVAAASMMNCSRGIMVHSLRVVFIVCVLVTTSVHALHGMKLFQQLKAVSYARL